MNGGSPAVDAGGACTVADQRDVARPQGEACDSGAVELEPGVSISSGPAGPTNRSAVAFGFTSPDAPGFECRLDAGAPGTYSPCTSPQDVSGLADGEYRFLVRAVDANFQPVGAAVRRFARAAAVRGGPCRARNGARPGPEP
jgi:hypothetical protein